MTGARSRAGEVDITVHDDRSLLAVQGPKAASVMQQHIAQDLSKVYFSNFIQGLEIAGVPDCFLTRTGCAPPEIRTFSLSVSPEFHRTSGYQVVRALISRACPTASSPAPGARPPQNLILFLICIPRIPWNFRAPSSEGPDIAGAPDCFLTRTGCAPALPSPDTRSFSLATSP